MEYPKCFQYIMSYMKDTDIKEKASFTLSFIQFLMNLNIKNHTDISAELDLLTLQAQRSFVERSSNLNFKELDGKEFSLETEEEFSFFMSVLYKKCGEPASFLTLFNQYGFSDALCKVCPFGVHFSSAYLDDELKLAHFMIQSENNFGDVSDFIHDSYKDIRNYLALLFQSSMNSYDILRYGSEFGIFSGLYVFIKAVWDNNMEFFEFNMVPSAFAKYLEDETNGGLPSSILSLGEDKVSNVQAVYDYILDMIQSAPDINYSEMNDIVKNLLSREPYTPIVDADARVVPYRQPERFMKVDKKNEDALNEIKKGTSKKTTVRRKGRDYECLDVNSYEERVFEDEYTSIISSNDDVIIHDETDEVIIMEGEVVDENENLVDPNMISDENSEVDLDDMECDVDEENFSFFGNGNTYDTSDIDEEEPAVVNTGSDFDDENVEIQNSIEDLDTVKNDFLLDKDYLLADTFDENSVCELPVFVAEPMCSELDRIQSNLMNIGYVYVEIVNCKDGFYVGFYLDNQVYMADLLTFLRITNRKSISVISAKPYLLYSHYAILDKTNGYRKQGKLNRVVPVLEVLNAYNKNHYSSISCDFKKRAVQIISYYLDNIDCFSSEKGLYTSNYVMALGYNLCRERYLASISKKYSNHLFELQNGTVVFHDLGLDILIRTDSVKKNSCIYKICLTGQNKETNSFLVFENLFVTLSERGDIRNLPFQILSYDKQKSELVILTMNYCDAYLNTILTLYLDHFSHQFDIKKVQIQMERIC